MDKNYTQLLTLQVTDDTQSDIVCQSHLEEDIVHRSRHGKQCPRVAGGGEANG